MDSPLFLIVGGVFALVAACVLPVMKARAASRSGELRFWVRGLLTEQVIRREDDPRRFDIELKLLRAMPWIGLSLMSLGILFMGFFL
jgi:hypothetical protein